jgi:hypothetical protein
MDAGSPTPPADALVVLQPCVASTPTAAQQVFAYRSDLTLQLVSSITPAHPNGLCVSSADKRDVRLRECGPWNQPVTPSAQQWSFNDERQFQANQESAATPGNLIPLCLNSQVENQPIRLEPCDPVGSDSVWLPSPSVGPGAAALFQLGSGSNQWVNYHEFSRCLAIDGQDRKNRYLIDRPCQQTPSPGTIKSSQLFEAPAIPAGEASVFDQISTDDKKSCLTNPGSVAGQVILAPCKRGSRAQTWIIYGGDKSLEYSTKYTVVNGSLCLALSAPSKEPKAQPTIHLETCSGTTEQKWNVVPSVLNGVYGPISALQNIHEAHEE